MGGPPVPRLAGKESLAGIQRRAGRTGGLADSAWALWRAGALLEQAGRLE